MKVAVIDMPTTYPPKKVNGFMVASIEPPNYGDYTFPKELQKQLEEKFSYRPDIETRLDVESKELEEDLFSLIETRFAILNDSLGKADFLHLTIVFTDYVMHFYWDEGIAKKVFKKIDDCLGELVKKAGDECSIIVMSDHGFAKVRTMFFANKWLQEQGMQKTKEAVSNALFNAGINREGIQLLLRKLGIEGIVKKIVPKSLSKKIKSKHGFVGGEETSNWFDWEKSKVVCNAHDLFYINPKITGKERAELVKELKEKLMEVRFPETNEAICEKVFSKEELYSGAFMEKAPDVITLSKEWIEVSSSLGSKQLFETGGRWIAIHAMEGIFIAKGPEIKKGFDAGKASILDLAPTILQLMNVPVPKDFDGKVLEKILEGDKA